MIPAAASPNGPASAPIRYAWYATVTSPNHRHATACFSTSARLTCASFNTNPIAATPITFGTANATQPHTP
ncbi:MAG: hypothetical protein R3C45_11370 [Phycisphaerales bacterium]